MNLKKTSLYSSIPIAVKTFSLLGINKTLAIFVGPEGYTAFAQLQNAIQIIYAASANVFGNCITRYTAQLEAESSKQLEDLTRALLFFCVFFSMVVATICLGFSNQLSELVLQTDSFGFLFSLLALMIPLSSVGFFLVAIFNGYQDVKALVLINSVSSILAFVFLVLMTRYYGLIGSLIALVCYQAFTLIIAIPVASRRRWFSKNLLKGELRWSYLNKLRDYLIIALFSALLAPLFQIAIRTHLIEAGSNTISGYWDAIWRLSTSYVLVLTGIISVYFLPKFSKLKYGFEYQKEVRDGIFLVLPVVMIGCSAIIIFDEFFIVLLYSSEFLPAAEILTWQMVGDCLRMVSWIMSYLMVARAMKFEFILSQAIFHPLFYFLIIYFFKAAGLKGLGIAHALNYFLYCIFIYFLIYRRADSIFSKANNEI